MKRSVPPPPKSESRRGLLLLMLLTTLMAGLACAWAWRFWWHLPQARIAREEGIAAARDRALQQAPAAVRDAWWLAAGSYRLNAAFHQATPSPKLQNEIGQIASSITTTQLGRLQMASARLIALRRGGPPPEQWWPALKPVLEGLGGSDFSHHERELVRALRDGYSQLGLGDGTACALARQTVGEVHGAFLQHLVANLDRMSAERAGAGDKSSAELCSRLIGRLLKQWTIEPALPGLRLLAADLLARRLEAAGDPAQAAVAQDLRAWRSAARERVRSSPPGYLSLYDGPDPVAATHDSLAKTFVWTTWLMAGVLASLLVTVACSPAARRAGGQVATDRSVWLAGALAAAVIAAGLLAWRAASPETLARDARLVQMWMTERDHTGGPAHGRWHSVYWWHHPAGAVLLTGAAVMALATVLRLGTPPRPLSMRLGAVACATCALLSVMLLAFSIRGRLLTNRYERELGAALRAELQSPAGADSDKLLERLRAWAP